MTREHKLALIIGFAVFMIVGVMVGDYFSKARLVRVDPGLAKATDPVGALPAVAEPLPQANARPAAPIDGGPLPPIVLDMTRGPAFTATDQVPLGGGEPDPVMPEPDALAGAGARADRAYAVKAGDTLYRLSLTEYGDGSLWKQLAEYNKPVLKGKTDLGLDMVLRIPAKEVLTGKPPAARIVRTSGLARGAEAAPVPKKPEKPVAVRTYTVKDGDILGTIALKTLGTSKRWQEIAQLNSLTERDTLRAGTVLKLPAR